jgi:chaperonin GroES
VATKSKAKVKAKAKVKTKTKVKAKPVVKTKTKVFAKANTKTAKPMSAKATGRSVLLKPLEDRVIVRIDLPEEKTAGGLFIPDSASTRPNRGQVVAAGPGRRNKKGQLRPLDVKTGDSILFPEYAGTKITMDAQEFLILREDEVLGIVT